MTAHGGGMGEDGLVLCMMSNEGLVVGVTYTERVSFYFSFFLLVLFFPSEL